jgi:hypothetical protein
MTPISITTITEIPGSHTDIQTKRKERLPNFSRFTPDKFTSPPGLTSTHQRYKI